MKRIELLAPAGNFDCLKAAVNNGANAVYLGGKNFSARAFANNFDNEELIKAIEYAHLRNVKIFVTLNTLLNENEFNNAIKMVDFYYQNNVDALLIQDLGLYYYIKNKYPDFELHCSTQMHVHNIEGVKVAKKLGFKRVVLARESDIELIKEACKQDIEIETFIHGAICVSYSGQCLMSSISKNRSANKGMCAQCCRLKYALIDEDNHKIKMDSQYLLSPKDMNLINDIPDLIKAGVASLKIEGRMKSPAYVAYITRMYRKAIDDYYDGKQFIINEEVLNNMKVLFNRNFTNDLLHNKNNLFGQKTPNHLGIEIGEVINNHNGMTFIKLNKKLNQFDGIRIDDFGCIVNMLYKNNLLVDSGDINDIVSIKTDMNLKGKVYKTLDYILEKSINDANDIKFPLNIKVDIKANNNVIVELECLNDKYTYISDIKAETALKQPLNEDSVFKQFNKLNDTIYFLNNFDINIDNSFLAVSKLNQIRRNAIDKFNVYRINNFNRNNIYADLSFNELEDDKNINNIYKDNNDLIVDDNIYKINYVINTASIYYDDDNVVISEIGGLLNNNKNKIAYYTLNCSNSYCYEFFKKLGFKNIVVSSELNHDDIKNLITAFNTRNNINIYPIYFDEGNNILMYLKNTYFDKYIDGNKKYYLDDGTNRYQIIKHDEITELVETKYKNNKIIFKIYEVDNV